MAELVIMVVIVCITINAIHKRNKRVEVIKEALQQGRSVNVEL